MKYLFKGNLKEFKNFTTNDLSLNKWKIYDEDIKSRFEQIEYYSYTNTLLELAYELEINHDYTEIISWLDSESIMLKVIKNLNKELINEINIIQELHIPFTNKRADYILTKDNKILILEFSYSLKRYSNYQYQTKLNQVINYQALLSNILPKHIEIGTYTFILHEEQTNKDSNIEEIINLSEFINFFFHETKKSALYYLENNNL